MSNVLLSHRKRCRISVTLCFETLGFCPINYFLLAIAFRAAQREWGSFTSVERLSVCTQAHDNCPSASSLTYSLIVFSLSRKLVFRAVVLLLQAPGASCTPAHFSHSRRFTQCRPGWFPEKSKHLWPGCCRHYFHRKWIPAESKDWRHLPGLNSSIWHCLAHWSSLQTE